VTDANLSALLRAQITAIERCLLGHTVAVVCYDCL
jgi:hypothetical protein